MGQSSRNVLVGLLGLLLLTCGPLTFAQQAQSTFGKNRIQYKTFNWRYYSSENFDIYFYDEGAKLSKEVLNYLEDEFDRITDFLGYYPYSKTKIFVYNNITDLQQSNVGVNGNDYNVGGQTNFVKSYIEVANPGTVTGLREELLLQISRLYINEMMFGGSLTDMFQSSYLLNLPPWFTEGAAYYVARGWDVEMDDFMRDVITTNRVKRLNQFTDYEAKIIGQSVWNFIAENYGRSNISNILNLTRIIRNEEKSIANTLGLPFKQVSVEWQNYYAGMAAQVRNNYKRPDEESRLFKSNAKGEKFTTIALSPEGKLLAYAENDNGKYSVKIKDLETGEEKRVLTSGYKVIKQEIDYNIPLLSWADEKTLGIIEMQKARPIMWLYDIETESKLPKNLQRFNQIHSFDFSQNGRLAILSADVRGQNDIYLVSIRRERIKRLTNDVYDDLQPKFIPGTNTIVFSSNRVTDTLDVKVKDISDISRDNYNLFYYNLDTTRTTLTRVTNTISRDFYPMPASTSQLLYLSEQKGIINLFRYNTRDSLYTQVTNYALSIKDYDIDFLTNKMAYVVNEGGRDYIHLESNVDFSRNIFTIQTMRQQVMQAKLLSERRKNRIIETKSDPIQLAIPDRRNKPEKKKEPDFIDTDNYIFDSEVSRDDPADEPQDNVSFLMQYRKLQTEPKVTGPFPYETRFSANNLITSWVIDPIRGFGILLETQMNDMLENHRFYGGIMATTDLRSGDIYAEYQYLKSQIDYSVRIDRNVIFWNQDNAIQKYSLNKLEVGASLPLTVKSRVSFKPFYAFKNFENLDPNLLTSAPPPITDNTNTNYLGFTSELVYDNSISTGLNLYQGTRGKLSVTNFNGIGASEQSFTKVSLDIRNYQKIFKEAVFATRLFYGRFMGNQRQDFLLGGMDNWLFNSSNRSGVGNPLAVNGEVDNSNLLFVDYVTSLRGFDYATLFGTNALVFNAELRLPVVRLFYSGPISSNFFRNLQFIGFYDLGSSWTGNSPLSTENSVNTEVITQGVWQAEFKNFRNPWLQSYGFGMRTVLLGYYMKFDLAWPIEDYDVGSPRLHVTLGLDF